ncbi:MAG TPA: dihydrofolate reductase, partial [Geobacteraceae bacterium]|nr:dihydrofolate reductase [Geobacteraceae bacterium]
AAMASNGVIGRDGGLPWHIPTDLRHFRDLTVGHTVIMGRKTFQSIGRPLPERVTIVITRQAEFTAAGVTVAGSLQAALASAAGESEVFICGGGEIYRQALPLADRIYLTLLDRPFAGDTFFPEIPPGRFDEVAREPFPGDPGGVFLRLERRLTGAVSPATVPA